MMKSILCLLIIGFAAVHADNYLCPLKDGDSFDCFEYGKDRRTCLTDSRRGGGNSYVVCSQCKKKWEFCVTKGLMQEPDHPERECGADYKSTPCTDANSKWSSTFKFRKQ